MAETLRMVPSVTGEAAVHDYPAEKIYAPWGMFASVAFHLTIVGIVIWLAYENHIRSLRDMMTAAIVDQPPQQLEVLLIDDKKEPPPTDHPLWIKELLIPKVKPPPPPPKPKPKPKPVVARAVPKLVPGTHSLPRPSYPLEAYENHIQGTVRLRVAFDGTGNVIDAEVVDSSGSSVLDSETRHFILSNWHDPDFAGQVQEVPIQYVLPK